MSLNITYSPDQVVFSSQIPTIVIECDAKQVDVRVSVAGQTVLNHTYFSYDGHVRIYDLSTLIEDEMRYRTLPFARVTITAASATETDTRALSVLYCEDYAPDINAADFILSNFLTTLQHRRLRSDSEITFYMLSPIGETDRSASLHCSIALSKRGEAFAYTLAAEAKEQTYFSSHSLYALIISLPDIRRRIAKAYGKDPDQIELYSLTAVCGARSASIYVDPVLECSRVFMFDNCFNMPEPAPLPCVTAAVTETEAELATVDNAPTLYDRQTTRTYETQTAPLTPFEAHWIDQLLRSRQVSVLLPSHDGETREYPAIITDYTCELSDTDEELPSVSFTWQLASTRCPLAGSSSVGIFTSPFDPRFT